MMRSSFPRFCRVLFCYGALGASTLPLAAADWAGGSGDWSSNSNPGWNGGGVPNGMGAVANFGSNPGASGGVTQDVSGGVAVGTLSYTNTSNYSWSVNTAIGTGIVLNQDGPGAGAATISNTNTVGTGGNNFHFTGNLTLADDLHIISLATGSTNSNGAIRISSVIGGSGNITVNTAVTPTSGTNGAVTFYNANTFVGSILIQKGTLYSAHAAGLGYTGNTVTLGASGQGDAALILAMAGTYAQKIVVASSTNGTTTLNGAQNLTMSGAMTLGGDLTVRKDTGTMTFSGAISGSGNLTKIGAGSLALTGSVNSRTGKTTISAGQISVQGNGKLGSGEVHVASGATLSFSAISGTSYTLNSAVDGSGRINFGSKTIIAQGRVTPGTGSTGTLTFEGSSGTLQFGDTTSFAYTLGTTSTLINLTNITNLNLGTGYIEFSDFSFTTGSGFDVGSYTLISGANSITGTLGETLSGVIGSGYAGTLALGGASGKDLVLTVTSAIPEPSTYALLLGAAALGLVLNRRRSLAAARSI